jgi:N utilization substance protein B
MGELRDELKAAREKMDPRHLERMMLVQALFIDEFSHQSWADLDLEFDREILAEIRAHKQEYDDEIAQVATERPLRDLARVDLAILRLIVHEGKTKKTPIKVLIDEGVELAKDFGGENSYAFVNAVLEKLLLKRDDNDDKNKESD